MNRFISILCFLSGLTLAAGAQQRQVMAEGQSHRKTLVAYFSATGTTARIAETVAEVANGELYEIEPEQPYTAADLDWNDRKSRSSLEMNDPGARPAIKGIKENISDYDVIFIGYPIWWNFAPRVINTFIENHKLNGMTVVPFATSGGSSIGNSVAALKKSYPDLDWKEGRLLNRADETVVREWMDRSGL